MKTNAFLKNLTRLEFFILFSVGWIGLGWLSLVLGMFRIFYTPVIVVYIAIGAVFLLYAACRNVKIFQTPRSSFLIGLLILISILILSSFTTPTIFSGRDQGSLSEAAIRLSQNHTFFFSSPASEEFFKIYGPGAALNFPGFSYTPDGSLITHFPLGYISWLASFYSLFGLSGFIAANAVSAIIFLLSFFLLCRFWMKFSYSLAALLLILTSFLFTWFFKFTLSENMALMLLWFGIYVFTRFLQTPRILFLISSLLSFGLLLFVRIEGLPFFLIAAGITAYSYRKNKFPAKMFLNKKVLFPLVIILILYITHFFINYPFYLILFKSLAKKISAVEQGPPDILFSLYLGKVFMAYALLGMLVFGLAGVLYLISRKKFQLLLPFLIIAPSLLYLLSPSISSDHPWMLRRFLFSVFPAGVFYTIWFFHCHLRPRLFYLFSFLLLIASLAVSIPYLSFSPHRDLSSQIEKLSINFKDSDLILIDQEASGDKWSMISGPMNFLHGKQSVYFFNPRDLDKINRDKFSSIYLIAPDHRREWYQKDNFLDRFVALREYQIQNTLLDIQAVNKKEASSAAVELPQRKDGVTYGMIYILKK